MLGILLAVTERDLLQALVRGAGLQISGDDLDALLPAWRRYQQQVALLREAFEENGKE